MPSIHAQGRKTRNVRFTARLRGKAINLRGMDRYLRVAFVHGEDVLSPLFFLTHCLICASPNWLNNCATFLANPLYSALRWRNRFFTTWDGCSTRARTCALTRSRAR
jgi:hypothetical protein